jgi:hypothetical protein
LPSILDAVLNLTDSDDQEPFIAKDFSNLVECSARASVLLDEQDVVIYMVFPASLHLTQDCGKVVAQ